MDFKYAHTIEFNLYVEESEYDHADRVLRLNPKWLLRKKQLDGIMVAGPHVYHDLWVLVHKFAKWVHVSAQFLSEPLPMDALFWGDMRQNDFIFQHVVELLSESSPEFIKRTIQNFAEDVRVDCTDIITNWLEESK